MEERLKETDIRQAIKIGCAIEGMSITDVAIASGKGQASLSSMMIRGNPSLKHLVKILDVLHAKLMVEYSNGSKVILIIN